MHGIEPNFLYMFSLYGQKVLVEIGDSPQKGEAMIGIFILYHQKIA